MLQPQTVAPIAIWPIPNDAPDLEVIVADQSATMTAQEALLHAYQEILNTDQNPPSAAPATGTGSAVGTQLTMSVVSGTIVNEAVIAGTGVPAGTTILGQISGATIGGIGVYLTSVATTASASALTFTPPPPLTTWPTPADAPTLMVISQEQVTIIRLQSSLLTAYQNLLNTSDTAPPATGP